MPLLFFHFKNLFDSLLTRVQRVDTRSDLFKSMLLSEIRKVPAAVSVQHFKASSGFIVPVFEGICLFFCANEPDVRLESACHEQTLHP